MASYTEHGRKYMTKGEKERVMLLENQAAIMTALIALTPPDKTMVVNNLMVHSAKTIAYVKGLKP